MSTIKRFIIYKACITQTIRFIEKYGIPMSFNKKMADVSRIITTYENTNLVEKVNKFYEIRESLN